MFTRIYIILSIIVFVIMTYRINLLNERVKFTEVVISIMIEQIENIEQNINTTKLNFIIESQDSIDLELTQHRDLILENQYAIAKLNG